MNKIIEKDMKKIISVRPLAAYKGDFGRDLIVAGSLGMAGAAIFTARAAMKSGAGVVTIATAEDNLHILQTTLPEIICRDRNFENMDLNDYDAIAIGPGMGLKESGKKYLEQILSRYRGKVVIDADSLNCIAYYKMFDFVKNAPCEKIFTPHLGEAARLVETNASIPREDEIIMLQEKLGGTVVLKGGGTLVFDGVDEVYFNTTGNPGIA
ncbi:MAG: NAD(P)H-hydrate dehydratase, partial [Anaerovoracaceae bacterium]